MLWCQSGSVSIFCAYAHGYLCFIISRLCAYAHGYSRYAYCYNDTTGMAPCTMRNCCVASRHSRKRLALMPLMPCSHKLFCVLVLFFTFHTYGTVPLSGIFFPANLHNREIVIKSGHKEKSVPTCAGLFISLYKISSLVSLS